MGIIDLRHHIDHPILGTWGGHCGYSVRPSERGKGYAKEMLRLNIQNAKRMGIPKLLVVCSETNTASEKTILANGGVFEKAIDMRKNKIKVDNFELRVIVRALADLRNQLIREGKPTEDVDELILRFCK